MTKRITCRICCCLVEAPASRRDELTGEFVEVCVSTDHDGLVLDADLAAEFEARSRRFDRKGLTRSPGSCRGRTDK